MTQPVIAEDTFPLSRYALHIVGTSLTPDVLRFRGTEALSQPFSWRIEFTCSQPIAGDALLRKYASFVMQDCKVVQGVVTAAESLSAVDGRFCYAITLESRLALLARSQRCAIYQHLSVPQVVEQVLRAHGLEGADFSFTLAQHYPPRALITQWRETDLQFIQRILAEVGIWFRQETNNTTASDVTLFGDSPVHYLFSDSLVYQEPCGLHDGAALCCWGLRSWHQVATAKVITRHDTPRDAAACSDHAASVRAAAVTTGEDYCYAGPHLTADDAASAQPESESDAFFARLRHERALNQSARLHLFSNAYWLRPGMVFTPVGTALHELQDGVLITFTSWRGARDTCLHVSVWGMPYQEAYGFRPAEIPRPAIHGTLPGRIESRTPDDHYAHMDEAGHYRVRMDFHLDACEPGFAYPWLRLMRPVAGDKHGWHLPLIAGTEVAVAFHDGDPDRPYIAYAFHDADHADIVSRDNRSQNILRTAGGNELRLEDQRGKQHIALTTPYGSTQLQQGHIVDQHQKPRGTGFELRTDEYGVMRAANGLLLSADAQAQAAGAVPDRETALREIERCREQLQQLAQAAAQAQALQADIASQIALFDERLKPLRGTLQCYGPQGLAITSGEQLQLAAAGNLSVNAGGDLSTGAPGNTTLLAGDRLGLFARRGSLRLISSQGPLELQAQNSKMHLSAAQKLSIASMSDILFAGKKRITLIGGGSYLKIEAGTIEYGTAGQYLRQVKRAWLAAPATLPLTMPYLAGDGRYHLSLSFFDDTGPIPAAAYTLHFDGGSQLAGVLDHQGYALHKNVPFEGATVTYQLPAPQPEPPWDPWHSLLSKTATREG